MAETLARWFERYAFLVRHDPIAMATGTVLAVVVLSLLVHFLDRRRLARRMQKNLPEIIGNYREKTVNEVMRVAEETISNRPELKSKTENMPWPVYFRFLRFVSIKTIDGNSRFVFHSMGLARMFGNRRKRNFTPAIPTSNEILESWWKLKNRKEYGHCHYCGTDLTLENNILKCPNCGESSPPILSI